MPLAFIQNIYQDIKKRNNSNLLCEIGERVAGLKAWNFLLGGND